MPSSLFPNNTQNNSLAPMQGMQSDPYAQLQGIVNILRGKDLNQVASNFARMNPQFAQFMQSVQGKSPEQFAKEHNIDFDKIMRLMR